MAFRKCIPPSDTSPPSVVPLKLSKKAHEKALTSEMEPGSPAESDVKIDIREVYFLIMHFLSIGPCQRTFGQFWNELLQHQLLPRRYHAWYSRCELRSGDEDDNGLSLPLSYNKLVERYPHVEKDHLVKLLKQLMVSNSSPLHGMVGGNTLTAADVPTLLGSGSFSLLESDKSKENKIRPPGYLRWPHMQADQVHGMSLREIGGGFTKHHRAPSIRAACYAIAKPSTMMQKMQIIKTLRGHRNAVYCATFDRTGRYVITGSDDRLVKIWSMETAFCLSSCRGHEGDITDLAVSSNSALVASSSNDFVIRVWRLPDGLPISVLRGHTGTVTAIAFSPRPSSVYQLLSSSEDGTCRIWDARYSQSSPRIFIRKPPDAVAGKNGDPPPSTGQQSQISCCAYNASGTVFVTGGSDTFARVWNAIKCNPKETGQPNHEMDILAGHENDVTYVQFSGCAVAAHSSMSDSSKEDSLPRFKNSWFIHDNIVTCSRDGSAIIWIPRSRRYHGKAGRWTRAYHLKVPPPPMPPQPTHGGPRQRFLPTPRGVNMIVWSLDNRFVLAAIMDCRICVWNAVDGSLVHSLTGHSKSTYVLDVHPFNPRIAMSAGYDGKTIVWDIWEGTPVRIYETGECKLVDGKFSPDGTSVVLSDHVGQIYILASGQGESQKDAQYDQFFLGDYRPLIQDTHGNVLDQETQLPPHRRNVQDLLCDSSMIPYPEPYQSMYQQRRLGALGVEWRPSSVKFAVGPADGQDFPPIQLAELDRWIEPLPDFLEMIELEQENDIQSDDNDSEYNVTEECSSEGDHQILSTGSSSGHECSADDSEVEHGKRERPRRSKRKKQKIEQVEIMTSSGRRVKRRNLDEQDATLSRNGRLKKPKYSCLASKKKSSQSKSSRPQRVAALNALNLFSRITEGSTDGEDEEGLLSNSSSESESTLPDSYIRRNECDKSVQKQPVEKEFCLDETTVKPPELEPQPTAEKRRRLVLKLPVRDSKKPVPPENTKFEYQEEASTSKSPSDTTDVNQTCSSLEASPNSGGIELREKGEQAAKIEDLSGFSFRYPDNKIRWGEVKVRTSKRLRVGDSGIDSCSASTTRFDGYNATNINSNGHLKLDHEDASAHVHSKAKQLAPEYECNSLVIEELSANGHQQTSSSSPIGFGGCKFEMWHHNREFKDQADTIECGMYDELREKNGLTMSSQSLSVFHCKTTADDGQEAGENSRPVTTKLRIRSKRIMKEPQSPSSKLKSVAFSEDWRNSGHDLMSKSPTQLENDPLEVLGEDYIASDDLGEADTHIGRTKNSEMSILQDSGSQMFTVSRRSKTYRARISSENMEGSVSVAYCNSDPKMKFSEAITDTIRRTRSMGGKATTCEQNSTSTNYMLLRNHDFAETSRSAGNFPLHGRGELLYEEWKASPGLTVRLRSARNRKDNCYISDVSFFDWKRTQHSVKKLSWLMLLEHEDSYRYIPQQGDEVAYLRQGHQEYIDLSNSREVGPWRSLKGTLRDVEFCKVIGLDYSNSAGSGESCCKLTLEFTDPSSSLFGKVFKLTLPELMDFSDFVVERTRYDTAISRNWKSRDKCQVWWRNENEEGGSWWEGRIIAVKPKYTEFPVSPWLRYIIQYKNDSTETHRHCGWELHDPDCRWEHPCVDEESREKLLLCFARLGRSGHQDHYGIQKLNQVSRKSDFLNRFPVPLSPDVIKKRLENNYYRHLEAVKHDMMVMVSNGKSYFMKNADAMAKIRRLQDWITRTFTSL